jgi:poly-gamma-glutamate capsule biosynthesis protein CapA/YwtB (metallophosphatase superfamily)
MSEKDIEVVFVGDSYVQRPDPDSAFAYVGDYLRAADIAFCNLETVIADPQYLVPEHRRRVPRTDEWMLETYLRAGIKVVNMANNPSMYQRKDCCARSICSTKPALPTRVAGAISQKRAGQP